MNQQKRNSHLHNTLCYLRNRPHSESSRNLQGTHKWRAQKPIIATCVVAPEVFLDGADILNISRLANLKHLITESG